MRILDVQYKQVVNALYKVLLFVKTEVGENIVTEDLKRAINSLVKIKTANEIRPEVANSGFSRCDCCSERIPINDIMCRDCVESIK